MWNFNGKEVRSKSEESEESEESEARSEAASLAAFVHSSEFSLCRRVGLKLKLRSAFSHTSTTGCQAAKGREYARDHASICAECFTCLSASGHVGQSKFGRIPAFRLRIYVLSRRRSRSVPTCLRAVS